MSDQTQYILVQQEKSICTITFNRPNKKHALTSAMYIALSEALQHADEDPQIYAVLIQGSHAVFTAGNDLQDFMNHPPQNTEAPVFRFLETLVGFSKPLVAKIDGLAVGIGTTMLLHCDFAYASDRSRFRMPFINLGVVPEAASSYLLPMSLGHRKASELLLLGEFFDARKALECGFINQVCTVEELDQVVAHTLQTLVSLPPKAMQKSKALLKASQKESILQVMHAEGDVFINQLGSAENVEAITAFFEKRPADFSKCT